jgi:hypothetical protein
MTWIQGFSVKKFSILLLYYYIMVYIKIRVNLMNHEVVQVDSIHCLNWQSFINFYKIKNGFKQNFEFKNITTLYDTNPVMKAHKKYSELLKNGLQFILGLLIGLVSAYSYYTVVSQVDGLEGIRTKTLRNLDIIINAIQVVISNEKKLFCDKKKQNLNLLQPLFQDLELFQKLKQKINDLPLTYFFPKSSRCKVKEIGEIISSHKGLNSLEVSQLRNFLKNTNFLSDIIENTTDKVL